MNAPFRVNLLASELSLMNDRSIIDPIGYICQPLFKSVLTVTG